MPLFKSSKKTFWLILASDDILKKVFIVGAYFGNKKPKDAALFLQSFKTDIIDLIRNGYKDEDENIIPVTLHCLICDAPAKSFVLNVKGHNAYHNCTKCNIAGKWVSNSKIGNKTNTKNKSKKGTNRRGGTVCFPPTKKPVKLKTDEDMANGVYSDDYQKGPSVFSEIPRFGFVSCVPRDYLHLILLGVMRRLIWLWIKGPLKVRLCSSKIDEISKRLEALASAMPQDFQRRPRSISEFGIWKGVEFRQFLLYTGPVVLKGILRKDMYENFLTLHAAILILINPKLVKDTINVKFADSLLKSFVSNFAKIYGNRYVTHNVHNTEHIAEDVEKYGKLDNFSSFRFENHMSAIKKLIRKPNQVLQQLARRSSEIESVQSCVSHEPYKIQSLLLKHSKGPVLGSAAPDTEQFRKLETNTYIINTKTKGDNCFLLKDKSVIIIKNLIKHNEEGIYLIGKRMKIQDSMYTAPIDSRILNIVQVYETNESLRSWPITSVQCKLWRLELENNTFVFPIHHTEKHTILKGQYTCIKATLTKGNCKYKLIFLTVDVK